MLAFIIPLKSSQVSGSWDLVCKLFERTLRSVCNQTSSDYQVIVVCHEKPNIAFESSQVKYLQVDLPLPSAEYASKEKDKMLKMQAGLLQAKSMNASHVMFVDADDCVSKRLVEFVSQNIGQNGWFFGKGYDYQEDLKLLRIRNRNLHLRTNTSHIIRIDLLEQEMQLSPSDVRRGDCVLYHIDTANILSTRGAPLKPLPFRGVIYITDNGENMWWSQSEITTKNSRLVTVGLVFLKKIYQILISRPVTNLVHDEFGLYTIDSI